MVGWAAVRQRADTIVKTADAESVFNGFPGVLMRLNLR